MEPMGALLLLIFAALFSIAYQAASPKISAYPRLQKYQGSYGGRTAIMTGTVFVLLVAVSFVMSFAYRKPTLPAA